MSGDYDPEQVAVRPAATLLLVQDAPGEEARSLRVLMLQRNARTIFAGGMWVFPGGRVDPADAAGLRHDHDDGLANAQLQLESGAMAFYVAAIREAFEEAGVLMAGKPGGARHVSLATDAATERHFSELRSRLNAGQLSFTSLLEREQLTLCARDLHYVARWITPLGPPRRFDTRFFLARMPAAQTPLHDDDETVHSAWFQPEEVLRKAATGELVMMTPTATMVRLLAGYGTTGEVMSKLAGAPGERRVRVTRDAARRPVVPGEPGYAGAREDLEFGWVRL